MSTTTFSPPAVQTPNAAANEVVTLLFAHANGFCKEVWEPVVRRIRQAPLLRHLSVEFVAYDQPFMGANRDESDLGEIYFKGGNSASLLVKHPINDVLAHFLGEARRQVDLLKKQKHRIIGIGHSLGAAALWAMEAKHPGTFDGLVLFEPVYGEMDTAFERSMDFMVASTLARESKWPSVDAATAYFANWKNFASWDRESLASYLKGGVVFDKMEQAAVLACHPRVEAAVYSADRLTLSASELAAPMCPIVFHSGSHTRLIDQGVFNELEQQLPSIYSNHKPMLHASHLLVVEDPEATSKVILEDLEGLESLKAVRSRL